MAENSVRISMQLELHVDESTQPAEETVSRAMDILRYLDPDLELITVHYTPVQVRMCNE